MQQIRRHIIPLTLVAVLATTLLVTCGDKGAGPDRVSSDTNVQVTLTKTSLVQAIQGVALEAYVDDSLVYSATTGITDGAFTFGRFQLPVGRALIVVVAFDEEDHILYEGQTELDIVAGGNNTVNVELTPSVPMVRLAPYYSERASGTDFESTVELHNVANFLSGVFTIRFDENVLAFADSISPGDAAWGGLSVTPLRSEATNEIQFAVRRLGNSDVVPAGVTDLAHVRFHGIATGRTLVSIDVVDLEDFSGPVPELNNLVTDDQTINLTGSGDPIVVFPDEGLDAAVRDALAQPTGPLFASVVATITELDAEDRGIVNLTGIGSLTSCQTLNLANNELSSVALLSGMTSLNDLDLRNNQISDIAALVSNSGLGAGDVVDLTGNPLSEQALTTQIPALRNRGVTVFPALSTLSGQVTDANTSVPITGADVSINGPLNQAKKTDSFGNYAFPDLPDGTYDVTVSAAGYETAGERVVISQGDVVVDVELTPIQVTPTISGTVTDSVSGDPIAGAMVLAIDTVTFSSVFDSTDANGNYAFFGLGDGFYQVLVTADTYLPGFDSVTVSGSPAILNFKLMQAPATISGTVRAEARTGQVPLEGATITLAGPTTDETTSASNGFYAFGLLVPGDYTLIASADNYDADTVMIAIFPGDLQTVDFLLHPMQTTVSGTVKSGIDGTGVPDASVRYAGSAGAFVTTTDVNGFYSLGAIPSGTYDVDVAKSGWGAASEQNVVVSGASFSADYSIFPMGISAILQGQVRDAQTSNPIIGANVQITWPVTMSVLTDAQGAYSFGSLSTGSYDMMVSISGYETVTRTIDLSDMVQVEDFALSQTLTNDLFRIVLTWGAEPQDLDIYYNASSFSVWWGEPGSLTSAPFVHLDVDDTLSFGPETITVRQLAEPANIVIHNYSADLKGDPVQLTASKGLVQIYDQSGLISTFEVPTTGTGFFWNVCDITIDGQIVPINQIVETPPSVSKKLSKRKTVLPAR